MPVLYQPACLCARSGSNCGGTRHRWGCFTRMCAGRCRWECSRGSGHTTFRASRGPSSQLCLALLMRQTGKPVVCRLLLRDYRVSFRHLLDRRDLHMNSRMLIVCAAVALLLMGAVAGSKVTSAAPAISQQSCCRDAACCPDACCCSDCCDDCCTDACCAGGNCCGNCCENCGDCCDFCPAEAWDNQDGNAGCQHEAACCRA